MIFWMVARREASLPARNPAEEATTKERKEARVDEQIAESFPASDPPSYAGGSHAIGGPRRRKSGGGKS
jgi:hypothetical protein